MGLGGPRRRVLWSGRCFLPLSGRGVGRRRFWTKGTAGGACGGCMGGGVPGCVRLRPRRGTWW